jgi:hypothetical protein
MGSLQNPFFTALVEEGLAMVKRPVYAGLFLFMVRERAEISDDQDW